MREAAEWQWTLLDAGTFRLDGGSMFGIVPKVLWSPLVTPDERNRIPLRTNCLLLERGGRRVLIETGFGDKWTDKERDLYELQPRTVLDALREIDVAPETIDHVIVTHLHFDHAAGLTRRDASETPVSSFPRARIHPQRTEWDDALANRSTMTRTYLRSHLDPIADQVEVAEGEIEILPDLVVWPVPGHTWGHQSVRFRDARGTVCFSGDVMPTARHAPAAFNMAYDMLPHENMRSKQSLLARASAEQWRLVLAHEPGHPVVRVEPDPQRSGRFRLVEA